MDEEKFWREARSASRFNSNRNASNKQNFFLEELFGGAQLQRYWEDSLPLTSRSSPPALEVKPPH